MGSLALDLSTRTGWAFGRPGATPIHGVWKLGNMSDLGRLCSCLANSLEDAIAVHQPRRVVFEGPVVKQQTTARMLMYLCGVVELISYEHSVRCYEQDVGTVRKAVLGRGRFTRVREDGKCVSDNKAQAIAWCRAQGWTPEDDNAADALVLLRYAHLLGGSLRAAA